MKYTVYKKIMNKITTKIYFFLRNVLPFYINPLSLSLSHRLFVRIRLSVLCSKIPTVVNFFFLSYFDFIHRVRLIWKSWTVGICWYWWTLGPGDVRGELNSNILFFVCFAHVYLCILKFSHLYRRRSWIISSLKTMLPVCLVLLFTSTSCTTVSSFTIYSHKNCINVLF